MSTHRSQARQKAAEQHRRAQEKARRQRITGIIAGVLIVALVVGGLILAATSGKSSSGGTALSDVKVKPAGLTDNAIVTGNKNAKATVTLYEDLQCPACKNFEATTGPTLQKLVDAGKVKLERRPLAFLDQNSTTKYSSRALNAYACVLDSKPAAAEKYLTALYQQQPAEGGSGLPNAALTKIAADAGAPGIGSCVNDAKFGNWVKAMTQYGTAQGVNATPTVLVNGKKLATPSPDALMAAVAAA